MWAIKPLLPPQSHLSQYSVNWPCPLSRTLTSSSTHFLGPRRSCNRWTCLNLALNRLLPRKCFYRGGGQLDTEITRPNWPTPNTLSVSFSRFAAYNLHSWCRISRHHTFSTTSNNKNNNNNNKMDYSVRNEEAQALQEIQGKNDWRDGSSNVSWKQILTTATWRSAAECSTVGQQRLEKLERWWLKDGCVGQAMMSMQSGDDDEPCQLTDGVPQQGTAELSGVRICTPEQPA